MISPDKIPAPRLSDVAEKAGVSPATVSRTLSRPDLVTEETRRVVMAAVAATGYRINHAARSLRRQQSGLIVALVPNLANPFFSGILAGMGAALGQAGVGLLVADTQPAEGPPPAIEAFLNPTRSDGVILLDGMLSEARLGPQAHRPPLVMACEWIEGVGLPAVAADNSAGAAMAIRHLTGLGHRHIAVLDGPARNVLTTQRRAGAEAAAREAGARLMWLPGDFSLASGAAAAARLLALPPEARPTAAFAFSDAMACGLMTEVQRAGLSVPGDLSVVGFDDIEIAPHLLPALTTIHQPREAIGRLAAQTVLALAAARIAAGVGADQEPEPVPEVQILPVELVIRASTGPAPVSSAA